MQSLACLRGYLRLLWAALAIASATAAQPPDAAAVAREYMTAFFHADVATATRLTHPGLKQTVRNSVLRDYETARTRGQGAAFLASLQIATEESLRKLSADELFARLMQGKTDENPEFRDAMKKAVVKVLGVETIDAETRRVKVSISAPSVAQTEVTELTVRRHGGAWLVER